MAVRRLHDFSPTGYKLEMLDLSWWFQAFVLGVPLQLEPHDVHFTTAWSSSISFLQSPHFHQFPRNQWQCSYRMLHTHCVRWRILSLTPSDGQTQSFGTFYEAMSLCRPGTTWLKTQWWCVPRELPKSVRVQGAWHGWWNWSPSAGIGDLNRLWLLLKNLLWMFWLLRHRESTRSTWLKDTLSLLHHTEAIIHCRNLLLLFAEPHATEDEIPSIPEEAQASGILKQEQSLIPNPNNTNVTAS